MPEPLTAILIATLEAARHMHSNNTALEQERMQLRTLEARLDHVADMADIQASLAHDFIRAMIDRRIDAVQSGFVAILSTYADQAWHYMDQQDKYVDASLRATTPFDRANYNSRLSEIDMHLSIIRMESRQLYQAMNTMILLIGGTMPSISTDCQRILSLEGAVLK